VVANATDPQPRNTEQFADKTNPPSPLPVAPTSGTLHYTGPPVSYGQTVTFTKLPGGRLRFTFDQAAWQPLIAHQPDGTQTLTLRSLKQDIQSRCDVAWEIIQ
jgi:hypothetical protein